MFGEGVFGAEGLFWCCGAMIALPALYAMLLPIVVSVPGIRWLGFMLLNAAFAYGIFGYFFGDGAGFFMAALVMFGAFWFALGGIGTVVVGARRIITRRAWRRFQGSRVFTNVEDFFTDGETPMRQPPKRKRDEDAPDIIDGNFRSTNDD